MKTYLSALFFTLLLVKAAAPPPYRPLPIFLGENNLTPIRERFAVNSPRQKISAGPNQLFWPTVSDGTQRSASYGSQYTIITDCSNLRFLYVNGTYAGASTGQFFGDKDFDGGSHINAGDISLKVSVDSTNSFWLPVMAPAAGGKWVIPSGGWVWTGPVSGGGNTETCGRRAGATLVVRTNLCVAPGVQWHYTREQIPSDDGTDVNQHAYNPRQPTNAADPGADTTLWNWVYGGAPNAQANVSLHPEGYYSQFAPSAVIATQLKPVVIVGTRGDSLMAGLGPSDHHNFVEHALESGSAVWGYDAAIAGSTALNASIYDHLTPQLAPYADYWVLQWQNDFYSDGETLAQMKAGVLNQINVFSMGGARRVILATGMPKVTGSYSTISAETIETHNSGNVLRTQFNDWVRDQTVTGAMFQSGGNLYAVIDPCAYVEADATNTLTKNGGYWYCGPSNDTAYTSDGFHPTVIGRDAMAMSCPSGMFQYYGTTSCLPSKFDLVALLRM